jgi:hypothetical protein
MSALDVLLWMTTTESIPLSPTDKLPETALVERVIHGLHEAIVAYVAAHPGRISRYVSRATIDMYRALCRHNLAELSTRLAIAVGEIEQCDIVALEPGVACALGEAQRFLTHGTTAVKVKE